MGNLNVVEKLDGSRPTANIIISLSTYMTSQSIVEQKFT